MPSLNLTKEDVHKQLADLRESLVSGVDSRIAEIKRDVDLVTKVRSEGVPFHADGIISGVQDIVFHEHEFRRTRGVRFSLTNNMDWQVQVPEIELAPGRYRVFIHVHKVKE